MGCRSSATGECTEQASKAPGQEESRGSQDVMAGDLPAAGRAPYFELNWPMHVQPEECRMPRFAAVLLLIGIALSTVACVVEEPGPGPDHDHWCYWHPGRCH